MFIFSEVLHPYCNGVRTFFGRQFLNGMSKILPISVENEVPQQTTVNLFILSLMCIEIRFLERFLALQIAIEYYSRLSFHKMGFSKQRSKSEYWSKYFYQRFGLFLVIKKRIYFCYPQFLVFVIKWEVIYLRRNHQESRSENYIRTFL